MSKKNSLALCIPAYNAAAYLPRLLQSAQKQSIPFDEILVYNDCSTDNTTEVAKKYGATVIEGDKNRGCSTGKNKLANIANSQWLHFHDADDDILPNFTSVAHRWIDKEKAPDIVLLHYRYEDFVTGRLLNEPNYRIEEIKEDVVKFSIANKIVNFAIVKKRSFLKIGGFNTDIEVLYNEDRAFYTRASLNGLVFDYEPEPTCINYFHRDSMSAKNIAKCAQAALNVWKYVIQETEGKYNKEIAHQLLSNAAYAATADDWKTVKNSIAIARKIFPIIVPVGSKYFQLSYKIAPFYSFYLREKIIRHFTSKRKNRHSH